MYIRICSSLCRRAWMLKKKKKGWLKGKKNYRKTACLLNEKEVILDSNIIVPYSLCCTPNSKIKVETFLSKQQSNNLTTQAPSVRAQ